MTLEEQLEETNMVIRIRVTSELLIPPVDISSSSVVARSVGFYIVLSHPCVSVCLFSFNVQISINCKANNVCHGQIILGINIRNNTMQ
jgi:hypothetical protein